ncbi:prenyltransferase/squalene oxidase repeat-containing protein [Streptomyces sp. NPDC048527]|uniref:prenyltransferase/squalene oxidase repeat-containing protein n=1 Tax=Streptomyces sp. NPDC048527 TaxID=3365568 RepID=UPI00371A5FA1
MPDTTVANRLERAVPDGAEALFAARREDGVVDLGGGRFSPGNTAVALIALHTAHAHDAGDGPGVDEQNGVRENAVKRLLSTQRPDGGWAMEGVPTEKFTTAVVAAALTLTATAGAGPAVAAARALVRRHGGVEDLPEPAMAGLVRQFDSLAGELDPATLPRLPMALLLLPGLARRALSLRLPIFSAMALGQSAQRPRGGLGGRIDAAVRPRALRIVRQAFVRERGAGSFSGDPWLTSLISIGISRSELAPDISRATVRWLTDTALPGGGWDLMPLDITWASFTGAALLEAGYGDDPRLEPIRDLFHRRQQDIPFPALACPEGHWGFSTDRSWPMALETAEISSLLHRLPGGADDTHVRRGLAWLTSMQDRSGSWSLAVRDSRPGGFGPCPQMTAKCVLALLDCGAATDDARVTKGLRTLGRTQRDDGAWEAMWYRGLIPGTSAALVTYARAGCGSGEPASRARDFLLRTQLADGSWSTGGHDPGAATADVLDGEGSVEETAWALHALLVSGEAPDSAHITSAAHWLMGRQDRDGTWPCAAVHEYVRHCYRYTDRLMATALAVKALARLRTTAGPGATTGMEMGTP